MLKHISIDNWKETISVRYMWGTLIGGVVAIFVWDASELIGGISLLVALMFFLKTLQVQKGPYSHS